MTVCYSCFSCYRLFARMNKIVAAVVSTVVFSVSSATSLLSEAFSSSQSMSRDQTLSQTSETVRSLPKWSECSTVHYTAHHNWAWILAEAIEHISTELSGGTPLPTYLCSRCKELPSQRDRLDKKIKIKYALYRLEIGKTCLKSPPQMTATRLRSVWATSPAFAFLDPKDALYRELQLRNCCHLMPKTTLLDWDITSTSEIGDLPSIPALLKASLGSGGFGLYFVYDQNDVLSIIKAHASRARTFVGFLDSLRRDHSGNIPCWSLQSLLKSCRVGGEGGVVEEDQLNSCHDIKKNGIKCQSKSSTKRCQIRVYTVCCGSHLYMYDTYEARLPSWDIDLEEILTVSSSTHCVSQNNSTISAVPQIDKIKSLHTETSIQEQEKLVEVSEEIMTVDEFETYCCLDGNARPYNQDRNKSITERFIFEELPELEFAKETVGNCVRDAMKALQIPILHQINASNCQAGNPSEVGVIHGSDSTILHNIPSNNNISISNDAFQETHSSHPLRDSKPTEMAICGIDLMLEIVEEDFIVEDGESFQPTKPKFHAYILEVNNNPAMAGNGKLMSVKYRNHLIQFVKNTLLLGLGEGTPSELNFEYLW